MFIWYTLICGSDACCARSYILPSSYNTPIYLLISKTMTWIPKPECFIRSVKYKIVNCNCGSLLPSSMVCVTNFMTHSVWDFYKNKVPTFQMALHHVTLLICCWLLKILLHCFNVTRCYD